jgi:aryl-alcohol dehydrogenase-like predicted oxidoreductase
MQAYFTKRNFELLDEMEAIGGECGKSMAQVSLAWLLTNPLITAPIVGARSAEQLQESVDAAGFRLTAEQMKRLSELTEWREKK